MGKFFKKIGIGILVILLAPFALAGFAIFIVIASFVFLFYLIYGIVIFFKGEKLTDPTELDRKAAKIMYERHIAAQNAPSSTQEAGKFAGATINVYGNISDANLSQPKPNELPNSDNVVEIHDYSEAPLIETKRTEASLREPNYEEVNSNNNEEEYLDDDEY